MLYAVVTVTIDAGGPQPVSDSEAAEQLVLGIGAKARPVRHLDRAVHVGNGLGVGDVGDVGEQPFERRVTLLAGDAVQRREIAGAEKERMRHAGDAAPFGFGRDPRTTG